MVKFQCPKRKEKTPKTAVAPENRELCPAALIMFKQLKWTAAGQKKEKTYVICKQFRQGDLDSRTVLLSKSHLELPASAAASAATSAGAAASKSGSGAGRNRRRRNCA